VTTDITERRLAEMKLKTYTQQLASLSRQLVQIQENERRHIARELHDEIGQALTAIEINLQITLRAPGTTAIVPRLEESLKLVERLLQQVQDLSLDLRPSMLDDLGLEAALRWYAGHQARRAGLRIDFWAEPLEDRLEPAIETNCFRVAQEAMTNVVRHARAQGVAMTLRREDSLLHLVVHDDGVGFDPARVREQAVQGSSVGLLCMEERVSLAGGQFKIDSSPEQGTEVHAWFPLKWRENKD